MFSRLAFRRRGHRHDACLISRPHLSRPRPPFIQPSLYLQFPCRISAWTGLAYGSTRYFPLLAAPDCRFLHRQSTPYVVDMLIPTEVVADEAHCDQLLSEDASVLVGHR